MSDPVWSRATHTHSQVTKVTHTHKHSYTRRPAEPGGSAYGVGVVGRSLSGVARGQRALLEADDAVGDVRKYRGAVADSVSVGIALARPRGLGKKRGGIAPRLLRQSPAGQQEDQGSHLCEGYRYLSFLVARKL